MGYIPQRETSSLVVQLGYAFQASFSAGGSTITAVGFSLLASDVGAVVQIFAGNPNPGVPGFTPVWATIASVNVGAGTFSIAPTTVPLNSSPVVNVVLYRPLTGLTNYILSGSTQVDLSLTQDSTAQFTIVSLDGSLVMNAANTTSPTRVGMPVLITDTEVGIDYFGGPVDQSRVHNEPGNALVYSECQCVSWNILARRRTTGVSDAGADGDTTLGAANPSGGQFVNVRPDEIIAYWVRDAMFDDGITTVLDTSGPQLPTFSSIASKVSDALDQLVNASTPLSGTPQFHWFFDPRRVLNWIKLGSLSAPFNISDADGSDTFFLIQVQNTISRQNYFNRGIAEIDSVAQTFIGNGSATSFTLSQTVPASAQGQVKITLNGNSQTVGISGVDIGKQWYYTIGGTTITSVGSATSWANNVSYNLNDVVTRSGNLYTSLVGSNKGHDPTSSPTYWKPWGAAGPLGVTDVLNVQFPVFVVFAFDDLAAQATQTQIESGSGISEAKINLNALNSVVDAETFVTSQVEIAKDYAQQAEVRTYKPGLNIGQTVQVNLKDIGLDSQGSPALGAFFMIDSVKISTAGNRKLFTVTASADAPIVGGPYSQLKRGLGTGGGVNAHPLAIPLSGAGLALGVGAGGKGGTPINPQIGEANLIPIRRWIDETGRQPLLNAMNNTETVPVRYGGYLYFAAACNDGTFQVFKSTDHGRTWTALDTTHAPADIGSPSLSGISGTCVYDGNYTLYCATVKPHAGQTITVTLFNLNTEQWGPANTGGPAAELICSMHWRGANNTVLITYDRGTVDPSPTRSRFWGVSFSNYTLTYGTAFDIGTALLTKSSNVTGDVNSTFATGVPDSSGRTHFLLSNNAGTYFWYQAVELADSVGSSNFFFFPGGGSIPAWITNSNVVLSTNPAGVQRVTAVIVTKE